MRPSSSFLRRALHDSAVAAAPFVLPITSCDPDPVASRTRANAGRADEAGRPVVLVTERSQRPRAGQGRSAATVPSSTPISVSCWTAPSTSPVWPPIWRGRATRRRMPRRPRRASAAAAVCRQQQQCDQRADQDGGRGARSGCGRPAAAARPSLRVRGSIVMAGAKAARDRPLPRSGPLQLRPGRPARRARRRVPADPAPARAPQSCRFADPA